MVYVVQEQAGKNILPAGKFGEIKVLLTAGKQVTFSAGAVAQKLMVQMSTFSDQDYLLLIGDPVLIGISCAVAAHWNNGNVKLLKWDRQEKVYYPVEFNLYRKENVNDTQNKNERV